MFKNTPLILLFFFFASPTTIYSQTGTIPTGTYTSCTNGISLFQKLYSGAKDDQGYHIAATADSGYVIVGQTNSFGNGGYDGLVMKVNKKGNTVWSKALGGSGNDVLYMVRRTSDNGFIACGQTKSYGNAAGDAWLVKLDASGTVQWSKKYGDGSASGEIGSDVIQLSDGGYALCGTWPFAPGLANSFVVRTDNQGNAMWSKQYGNSNSDNGAGITEDGNFLVLVGNYYASTFYDSYVIKLDKSNGAVQWIKGFDGENRSTWFSRISKTSTGYQVLAAISDNFTDQNQQESVWNLNTDGTLQNVRKLVIPGTWSISYGWYPLPDGGFIGANSENNNSSNVILCRVNGNGSLAWSKKYIRNGRQLINDIVPSPEGGYAAVGFTNNAGTLADSNNVYLMRVDSLGDAGNCSGVATTDLSVVIPSYTTPTPDVVALGNLTVSNPVITVGEVNFIPATNSLCFYCQPKPTGTLRPATGMREPYVLKAYPNPVIGGIINLSIDAEYDNKAVITIADLYGNILYISTLKEIKKGNNLIRLNTPYRLQAYTNYFVNVKYNDFANSVKIFVIGR